MDNNHTNSENFLYNQFMGFLKKHSVYETIPENMKVLIFFIRFLYLMSSYLLKMQSKQ